MAAETGTMMTALRAHERGGPEQLVVEQAPRPRPAADEVLVAVEAAAITVAELTWPETWESDGVDRTPIIPSHEFAGTVAATGADVEGFAVGDRVFGLVPFDRDGAAAEFVAVPTGSIAHRSASVPAVTAAAAVLPALTAWEALVDRADLRPGQRLLVRGGTGAVGSLAVQIGHDRGADTTATVSNDGAAEAVRALGADAAVVVPHGHEPDGLQGFDVTIDAVGDDVPEWVYASVRRGGKLVVLQEPPRQELAERHGIDAEFFVVSADQDRLEELDTLLAAGRLSVAVSSTLPISRGRAAFEAAAAPGRAPGKTLYVFPGPTDAGPAEH